MANSITTHRAIFRVTERTLTSLITHWPELTFEPCEDADTFWIGGRQLDLNDFNGDYRTGLAAFVEKANCLIALTDAKLSGVQSLGSLEVIDGDKRHRICLVKPARLEMMGAPIILSTRGTTRPLRSLVARASDLLVRDDRFARATTIFAACGEDLRELFKVVELIERAHGKLPNKRSSKERQAFFHRIEVAADDWEALHRSFRPQRHAEAHDMEGRTVSPRLARLLIHHALKLWLAREIPA